MKLSKIAEIGAAVGAATLAGINTYEHKKEEHEHKEHNHKKLLFTKDHIALYSSLFAAGLALWEIKKHHHVASA
jgi:hypothetical protein